MRKLLILILALLVFASALFASDWKFVFGALDQNPEILWGFLPSYLMAGVGYDGLRFIPDDLTEIQVLFGGGYNNRIMWQDPETGEIIFSDPLIYNVMDFDWAIRVKQGFLSDPLNSEDDLLTLTLSYNGQYERAYDSLMVGDKSYPQKFNGITPGIIASVDSFLGYSYDSKIYPELNGDHQFLGTQFAFNIVLDMMEDSIHHNDGFKAEFELLWGPKALNRALDGYADYFVMNLEAVGAYTLYSYETSKLNWFSLVLIDRAAFSWVTGDAVPAFIQGPVSLGRKMRGFNTYTYGTEFSFVNNLDLRIAGPDMGIRGLAPRINIFADFGWAWGDYFNTDISKEISANGNFLSSVGVQFTVTIFDFIDLGYQLAWPLTGWNFKNGTGYLTQEGYKNPGLVGSFTFFLDF